MVGKVKQRDITDCGAACLASVAMHYHLKMPVSLIRQMAATDKKGTNVLGMMEAAEKMGFMAKGVKGEWKSLFRVPLPAIAHVIIDQQLHHFVVIAKITPRHIHIMDPADGKIHHHSHEHFRNQWSGVLIILFPGEHFVKANRSTSLSSRFMALLKPHRRILLQVLTGAIIISVLGLGSAIYIGKIVDQVIPSGNVNLLNLLGVVMLIIIGFQLLLGVLKMQFVLKTGQKIDATLILGYYKHILRLPISFFDHMRVGEILSRLGDAVKVRVFVNDIAVNLLVNMLILVVSFTLMFAFYWKLAIVMLAVIPLYVIIYMVTNKLNKKVQRKIMERSADLESQLVESLKSIPTVKCNNLQWHTNLKTETRFTSLLAEIYKSGLNNIFSGSSSMFIKQGFTIILIWVGTTFVFQNQLTTGELMSFYAIMGYFTGPVSGIIGFNQSMQDALIASDRLFEIFDLEQEDQTGKMVLKPEQMTGIVFKDVCFRYGTRVQVFEDLNLSLESGKITAITGESGCGKTTIARLLVKMYPLEKGAIFLGDYNINHFTLESIRNEIGIVPQHIDLFAGHVIDNIAIGEFEPDVDRVMDVCNQLGLSTFIEKMPNGYQTYLGENGAVLSGGQKQRIAIARMLYRDPSVLVLDEATSSLDRTAEQFVHNAMTMMRDAGKIIMVVAHRLSTIMAADKVVVIAGGKVVQEGDAATLMGVEGQFREMFLEKYLVEG